MVETPQRGGSSYATSTLSYEIALEPVYLSREVNEARLKRLAKKILACIEQGRRESKAGKGKRAEDDIFSKDYDEIFGLR